MLKSHAHVNDDGRVTVEGWPVSEDGFAFQVANPRNHKDDKDAHIGAVGDEFQSTYTNGDSVSTMHYISSHGKDVKSRPEHRRL